MTTNRGRFRATIRVNRNVNAKLTDGDVSERPKELASKASVGQPTEGSNPSVTASAPRACKLGEFYFSAEWVNSRLAKTSG